MLTKQRKTYEYKVLEQSKGQKGITSSLTINVFAILIIVHTLMWIDLGLNTIVFPNKFINLLCFIMVSFVIIFLIEIVFYMVIFFLKKTYNLMLVVFPSFILSIAIFLSLSMKLSFIESFFISLFIVSVETMFGISIYFIKQKKKKILSKVLLVLALSINLGSLCFLAFEGKEEKNFIDFNNLPKASEELANSPGNKGNYTFKILTYGSELNKRRKEYDKEAKIKTNSVNVIPYLGRIKGLQGELRKLYWGFSEGNFPLNAKVYYPEGTGKYPLVLMVHGNHAMEEPSDLGYDYLGELLSSRGYIFVSVDENFLNGNWYGNLKSENDLRGIMLLQHLELWNNWNSDEKSIFYNKVDLENICLIGHSRGGEAVCHAAAFNKLEYYPEDGEEEFKFNFNIKSIVAIAPTDGQYKPGGKFVPLKNVDYMVIQGANDSDISSFYGKRQFNRIQFDDNKFHFKTSLYIGGANHGQFNTQWGRHDTSFPGSTVLNTKSLLTGDDQRKIANIYISAFLDLTLKNRSENLSMMKNYLNVFKFMPKTTYINNFKDSTFKVIADFDEDIDISTTTVKGGKISVDNIFHWREKEIELRNGEESYNTGVFLKWNNSEVEGTAGGRKSSYNIVLPEDFLTTKNQFKYLTFEMANVEESSGGKKLLDLSLEVQDKRGQVSKVKLKDYGTLYDPIKVRFSKLKWMESNYGKSTEPNLQVFFIPLEDFYIKNNKLNLNKIKTIKFKFDKINKGEIALDNIGFSR